MKISFSILIFLIISVSCNSNNKNVKKTKDFKVIKVKSIEPKWFKNGSYLDDKIYIISYGAHEKLDAAKKIAYNNMTRSINETLRILGNKQFRIFHDYYNFKYGEVDEQINKGLEALIYKKDINISSLKLEDQWWRLILRKNKMRYEYFFYYSLDYNLYLEIRKKVYDRTRIKPYQTNPKRRFIDNNRKEGFIKLEQKKPLLIMEIEELINFLKY